MNNRLLCVFLLACALVIVPAVHGAEFLYRDIYGNFVEFDPVKNWGYDAKNPHSVVYYPGTDSPAFQVTYQDVEDGSGIGFDDPTQGANRRARVDDALTYIAGVLGGGLGAPRVLFESSINDPGDNVLAYCGTSYRTSPPGFQGGLMYEYITTGIDPTSQPHGVATVNFGHNWYAGTGSPGPFQYDLMSVMIHEVTHALGFASLVVNNTGASGIGARIYSIFDSFLVNGNNEALFNSQAYFIGTTNDLLGQNGGIKFTGPEATAEYGINPPIYAPNPWEPGSSISHWATSVSNAVMLPFYSYGQVRRVYLPFEIACLEDLGYDLGGAPPDTPVPTETPEPEIETPTTSPFGIAILVGLFTLLVGVTGKKRR